jgi:Flp pilus assembly pilin Flp
MTLPWPAAAAWRGQGLVEYGLILGLTALLTVVILVFFGGTLADVLDAIGDAIDAAG